MNQNIIATDLSGKNFSSEIKKIIKEININMTPIVVDSNYDAGQEHTKYVCGVLNFLLNNLESCIYKTKINLETKQKINWAVIKETCVNFDMGTPNSFVLALTLATFSVVPKNLFKELFLTNRSDNMQTIVRYIVLKIVYRTFRCEDRYVVDSFDSVLKSLRAILPLVRPFNEVESELCEQYVENILLIALRK